jgi:hypothetical protein
MKNETIKKGKSMIDNDKNNESAKIETERQHLLTDENFIKIRQLQNEISESTGISPSIRTLLNMTITNEILENVKTKLISQFNQIQQ